MVKPLCQNPCELSPRLSIRRLSDRVVGPLASEEVRLVPWTTVSGDHGVTVNGEKSQKGVRNGRNPESVRRNG